MDYAAALQYLYSFIDWERGIGYGKGAPARFTLGRIEALLRLLDDPHRQFPSVHIAGSKGKGSTAAILESVLRAAGYRTGLYTQPHLHTFRERMRVDNIPVDEGTFARLVERVGEAAAKLDQQGLHLGSPTTYELATALGFLCFKEAEVGIAVVEVGLGGRLDATNVLSPLLSVITSISLEHAAILGNTLEAVAQEKAGIIKDCGTLVHAPNPAAVEQVFQKVCLSRHARIVPADLDRCRMLTAAVEPGVDPGSDSPVRARLPDSDSVGEPTGSPWTEDIEEAKRVSAQDTGSVTASEGIPIQALEISVLGQRRSVRFPLLGSHQRLNLGVALTALDELAAQGLKLELDAIAVGIETVGWPGRFEQLSAHPLVIADGAHTPEAMVHLRETIAEYYPGRRVRCILGVSRDKDAGTLLDALLPGIDGLIVTRSRHPRAQDPQTVADLVAGRAPVRVAQSVAHAISQGQDVMKSNEILCATGSLFVAAEAREYFGLAECVDPSLDN
jgi:dihydrofolate synthase/folylpolyglutamate synthase